MPKSETEFLPIELAEKQEVVPLPTGTTFDAVHIFDADSIYAINAALASERPLLVRGEPGVGKSQLARAAAMKLHRVFLQYAVDIQTEAKDLLWHFDSIQRLAQAQVVGALAAQGERPNREDIQADLAVAKFLHPGRLWWAFDSADAKLQAAEAKSPVPVPEGDADWAKGCVVLIDEIDKAETDVPNGLLEALGARQFTPIGRSEAVRARPPFPLVVITTNEERALPDAFLRRCMVLNLELPANSEALIQLLVLRGGKHFPQVREDVRQEAARMLDEDRKAARDKGLRPPPGQAEYMDLLRALDRQRPGRPKEQKELLERIRRFALNKHRYDPKRQDDE